MKKQLLVLPLLIGLLASCGETNDKGKESQQDESSINENDSTIFADSSSSQEDSTNDGLSIAKAFSVEEMISFMSDFESGKPSQKEYYVTGVLGDSSYDSEHTSYTAYFENHMKGSSAPAKIYSAQLDSSIKDKYTARDALKGATVVVKGYLELFNGEYEIAYLNAKYSPTGSAVSPVIVSIQGGTPDSGQDQGGGDDTGGQTSTGVCGKNATSTGTIPENAQTIKFDFSSGTITGISATSSKTPDASGVATVNGYDFNYVNAIAHAPYDKVPTGYLGLCAKGGNGVASFANKTAIPGKIVKVDFTMPTGADPSSISALAPFVIDFSTSALGSTTQTTGQTGGSGVSMGCYSSIECSYFSISCIKGVNGKGEAAWYNGYIEYITVTYVA